MRKSIALICGIFIVLTHSSAYAFFSRGYVNDYLKYEHLEISGRMVTGDLINITGKSLTVFIELHFCNGFNESHNYAKIYERIPPDRTIHFSDYLRKHELKETKDAHHVEWRVKFLKADGKTISGTGSVY